MTSWLFSANVYNLFNSSLLLFRFLVYEIYCGFLSCYTSFYLFIFFTSIFTISLKITLVRVSWLKIIVIIIIVIIINELHRAGPNNFTTRSMLNISVSRLLNHSLRNSPPLTRTPENCSLRRVQTREKGSAVKEIGNTRDVCTSTQATRKQEKW